MTVRELSGTGVTVTSWVEPIGSVDSLYSLGGGQRIPAATAPRECVIVELPRALALVNGHGNADGHAAAYFDTAHVAGWFVGRMATRLAESEGTSPGEAIEAASAELPDYIRRENADYRARTGSTRDGATFRLTGTFLEAVALRWDADARSFSFAVVGDIAVLRLREGELEAHFGGTLADLWTSEAEPPPGLDMTKIIANLIDSVTGEIRGAVRSFVLDAVPGDKLLLTTCGVHRAIEVETIARALATGSSGVDALRAVIAAAPERRGWPYCALLEL